jgi:hypothetical protein
MSVKIMGLVWDLDNETIDREEKYILLAYADHADSKGKSIFPSVNLICEKTGYKERSAQMITKSLHEKGFLIADGKGPKGTNRWSIPLDDEGVRIAPAKTAPLQFSASGGAEPTVRGVHTSAPKPLKPSDKPSDKASPRANQIPEVVLYREVTKLYPPSELFDEVVSSIATVRNRLGREVTCEDLLPFRKGWVSKGYNRFAITWLQWAETGQIPQNGTWKPREQASGFGVAQRFLERHSEKDG